MWQQNTPIRSRFFLQKHSNTARNVLPTHECGSVGLRPRPLNQPVPQVVLAHQRGMQGELQKVLVRFASWVLQTLLQDLIPLSGLRWRLHKDSLLQLDLKPSQLSL